MVTLTSYRKSKLNVFSEEESTSKIQLLGFVIKSDHQMTGSPPAWEFHVNNINVKTEMTPPPGFGGHWCLENRDTSLLTGVDLGGGAT